MFRFIIQKLLNKKWLISCMLIGTFLLIAIACCNPMYTTAALQKMLTDEMEEQMEKTNVYPAISQVSGTLSDSRLKMYSSELFPDPFTATDDLAAMYKHPAKYKITLFETADLNAQLTEARDFINKYSVSVSTMSDFKDHTNIIYGEMYSDTTANNVYEGVISEKMLTSMSLLVGDTIYVDFGNHGSIIKETEEGSEPGDNGMYIKITGVFGANELNDIYWINDPLDYENNIFINYDAYKNVFFEQKSIPTSVNATYSLVFDYLTIKTDELNDFIIADNKIRLDTRDHGLYTGEFTFEPAVKNYRGGSTKVTVTMWIFQLPVLILLSVFIFMVSNQIISIEQSEIAMLKSRGVSKRQLILAYLGQGTIIATLGFVIGYPLGYLFCMIFGSTKSFLEFSVRTSIDVHFTVESLIYAVIAALVSIIIMTIPVLKYANFSIVEQKANKKKRKQPLWQRIFLDFILLGISIYGLYSFNNQKDVIIANINNGGSLDPLLYFSSTVFILSSALLLLRILPYIAMLIYKIGKKKWSPSSYAAFMQIDKNIRKQGFIIVFLVLTLSLGIFNATTARSINDNEEIRLTYDNGAIVTMKESWKSNLSAIKAGYSSPPVVYTEPDHTIYNILESKVNGITNVFIDPNASVSSGTEVVQRTTHFMAITTDEFGMTAYMPENATKYHWYYYLNALAQDPYGAIISRNYAKLANLNVGDQFTVYRNDALGMTMPILTLNVSAIVDAFPSYEAQVMGKNKDGSYGFLDQYLVVCNYETAKKTYGAEPYEIWVNCKDTQVVYDFAEENNLTYLKFVDSSVLSDEIKEKPFFQVTSGMLTITFVVVLVLSMIGFLIYWITSIKSRELIFGIYRAMGMSMTEIIKMLIFEHLFGSLIPIGIGVVIGIISSKLFVPLIQLAYSPTYSTIASRVLTGTSDMIRIGICVLIMLVTCFYLLARILSSMKVAQALKLGED